MECDIDRNPCYGKVTETMKLSVVTTLYQSSGHLAEFYRRMSAVAESFVGSRDFEIILVNDGSPDDSLEIATGFSAQDRTLKILDLSRNFGHHQAMIAGLAHSKGDLVFLIDSDLEEQPEWLLEYAVTMRDSGADAVYGVQRARKGGIFERFSGWLFYVLFGVLTGYTFPKNVVTARLMTRSFVDAFLTYQEREVSIGGLFHLTGFDQQPHLIDKGSTSKSTYTFGKKLAVLVNSIVSFSNKPLFGIFVIGTGIFFVSVVVSAVYTVKALFFVDPPSGWTTLIVSVWMLGGLIISCIGVVGIYLAKVYSEAKQRPRSIVKSVIVDGRRNSERQGAPNE